MEVGKEERTWVVEPVEAPAETEAPVEVPAEEEVLV